MRRWLYLEFWWAIHNLVAHPLMQLLWWASLCGLIRSLARLSDWTHEVTVPSHEVTEGGG